jgi:hypothetical protein
MKSIYTGMVPWKPFHFFTIAVTDPHIPATNHRQSQNLPQPLPLSPSERIHATRSLSRAVAWNRGAFLQRRLNLAALLSAQRRELEPALCSQCTNNFCRDHLFVAVRQRNFERYGFAQYQSFSNECPNTTFAEITRPPQQAKFLAVTLETNPNPRLEHVPG